MTVNYKGTIVEIAPEEYRYVTYVDLKPCFTIAGGHDAHCIACFEAASAFWPRDAPPPPGCPIRSHPQGGMSRMGGTRREAPRRGRMLHDAHVRRPRGRMTLYPVRQSILFPVLHRRT